MQLTTTNKGFAPTTLSEAMTFSGTPNPVAVCVAKRKGRKPVTARFSVEDAKRAGLWAKQGPWSAYPKRMMQMRARGFALRDAFPDVLKGMITVEEAQDYPEEAKPRQVAKPANPLDMVAPPPAIEQTSNPAVIEAAFAYDQEAATVNELVAQAKAADMEVVDILEVAELAPTGELFAVLLPGKDKPHSMHGTLEEWQDAYEAVAEKTAMATKVPARERMTKLRELRELNEPTIGKVEMIARIRHTAAYSKRLGALGAAQ